MTHGKRGSSTRAHTHTDTDTHTLSSCKPLDAPSSPLSKSKLFWVFAEGTASFLWAWESTGMLGRPEKRTFRPKPRLRKGKRWGLIGTGAMPVRIYMAFVMIINRSRKSVARQRKAEETVSLPLSLFWRKQQRLLAERQPWGYSSCLQICDHKKSLSLWNTAIWEIIKRWPGGRAANLKDYAPARPPAPDLPGSQLSARRRRPIHSGHIH